SLLSVTIHYSQFSIHYSPFLALRFRLYAERRKFMPLSAVAAVCDRRSALIERRYNLCRSVITLAIATPQKLQCRVDLRFPLLAIFEKLEPSTHHGSSHLGKVILRQFLAADPARVHDVRGGGQAAALQTAGVVDD